MRTAKMRIRDEEIPKTTIRTRFGSYEWPVPCFGLNNAPDRFTLLSTTLLQNLNGEFWVVFPEEILVYRRNMEEQRKNLRDLFDILRRERLLTKPSNCKFGSLNVESLRYEVRGNDIDMQADLRSAILD